MKLIIIEGPDGAGKSRLVENLVKLLDGRGLVEVAHHGPYPGEKRIADHYLASFAAGREQYQPAPDYVILDRCWLSELVYGPIFREAVRLSSAELRILTRAALGCETVVVYALPGADVCVKNMAGREKDNYLTARPDRFKRLYAAYRDQWRELMKLTGLPTIVYNYAADPNARGLAQLLPHRALPPNLGPGAGSWKRGVYLLVGEQPGQTQLGELASSDVPFSGFAGCSPWLADQLDRFGVPESRLYWVNALNRNGQRTDHAFVEDLKPRGIIALGAIAEEWCRDSMPYATIPHPQYWKRFHAREEYDLARAFADAEAVMK